MNDPVRRFPRLLPVLGAALLALSGCGSGGSPGAEPPLAGARIGGPFTLIDQDGKTVTDRSFAGRYRLIYFGYTFCPDVCPASLQKLSLGLAKFEASDPVRGAKVQPIFITVDPERDTPAVMKQYVAAFHPRLIGLTGTPQQIAAVAKEFGVWSQKQKQDGVTGYLVNHTSLAILFDPDGKPIATVPQDEQPEDVAKALAQWVR